MDQRTKDVDGIRNGKIGQKHLDTCSPLAKVRNDFLRKMERLAFGLAGPPSSELS